MCLIIVLSVIDGYSLDSRRYIAGVAYSFYKNSRFMIAYDRNEGIGIIGDNTNVIQYVIEVRF